MKKKSKSKFINPPTTHGSFSRYFDLDAWYDYKILNKVKQLSKSVQKTYPFLLCAKASTSEKDTGCKALPKQNIRYEDNRGNSLECFSNQYTESGDNPCERGKTRKRGNNHPTTKPVKLMSYLTVLASRTGDTILDPFLGSGTTAVACEKLNRRWIGIELSEDYCKIAKARIEAEAAQGKLF